MHAHTLVDRYMDGERKREITSCDRNDTVVKILFESLVKYTETKKEHKKKRNKEANCSSYIVGKWGWDIVQLLP